MHIFENGEKKLKTMNEGQYGIGYIFGKLKLDAIQKDVQTRYKNFSYPIKYAKS